MTSRSRPATRSTSGCIAAIFPAESGAANAAPANARTPTRSQGRIRRVMPAPSERFRHHRNPPRAPDGIALCRASSPPSPPAPGLRSTRFERVATRLERHVDALGEGSGDALALADERPDLAALSFLRLEVVARLDREGVVLHVAEQAHSIAADL